MSSDNVNRAKRRTQYIPNATRGCLDCGRCEFCIDRSIIEWEQHYREQAENGVPAEDNPKAGDGGK